MAPHDLKCFFAAFSFPTGTIKEYFRQHSSTYSYKCKIPTLSGWLFYRFTNWLKPQPEPFVSHLVWVDEGQSDRLAGQSDSLFCEVQSDTSLARLGLTFFSQSDALFFLFSYITYFLPRWIQIAINFVSMSQIAPVARLPDWLLCQIGQIGVSARSDQTVIIARLTLAARPPDWWLCQIARLVAMPGCQQVLFKAKRCSS